MHRWSKLFIPTLREAPADAEVASHKFLLRAGYIRQVGAGIYSYLFLGQRSINKIQAIVREEMDRIGQEFLLPALHPRELWEESGRWTGMGQNLFKLQDRKGAWLALGMTHEEVMTDIARKELRSYKQLPQIWYQIQTKFRDEPRPRAGLLRVRQFIMKDSYSFDLDAAGLDESYNKHDAGLSRDLYPLRPELRRRAGRLGRHGWLPIAGVHGLRRRRRRSDRQLPDLRLCGECRESYLAAAAGRESAATGNGEPELVHTPGTAYDRRRGRVSPTGAGPPGQDHGLYGSARRQRRAPAEIVSPVVVLLRGDHSSTRPSSPPSFPAPGNSGPMWPEEMNVPFMRPPAIWDRLVSKSWPIYPIPSYPLPATSRRL